MTFRNTFSRSGINLYGVDPKSIADLFAWYDAGTVAAGQDEKVVTAVDKSGQGHNAAGGEGAIPQLSAAGKGRPASWLFGEGFWYILDQALNTDGEITIVAVFKRQFPDYFNTIASASDGSNATSWLLDIRSDRLPETSGKIRWRQGGFVFFGINTISQSGFHTVIARRTRSGATDTIDIWVDGVREIETVTTTNRGSGVGITPVFANQFGGGANGCNIAEILFYLRGLTNLEVGKLHAYMFQKHGPSLAIGDVDGTLGILRLPDVHDRTSLVAASLPVPAAVPDLLAWYDVGRVNLNEGDLISRIESQGNIPNYNGFHADGVYPTQPTLIASSGPNGRPLVQFNGVEHLSVIANLAPYLIYNLTMFAVFSVTSPVSGDNQVVIASGTDYPDIYIPLHLGVNATGFPYVTVANAVSAETMVSTQEINAQRTVIVAYTRTIGPGRTALMRIINGNQFSHQVLSPTIDPAIQQGSQPVWLGQDPANGGAFPLNGSVFEILIYWRQLSKVEIVKIERHLMEKYGLTPGIAA